MLNPRFYVEYDAAVMRGKIVLIYPNAGQDVMGINVGLPLSVLYIGTALKQADYDVTILDQRIHSDFGGRLKKAVAAERVHQEVKFLHKQRREVQPVARI